MEAIIAALITGSITVTGFAVTFFISKRNTANEIAKLKTGVAMEKLVDLPYQFAVLIQNERGASKERFQKLVEMRRYLYMTALTYGSDELAKLVAAAQTYDYWLFDPEFPDRRKTADRNPYYLALLVAQLKLDVSGVVMKPDLWLKMTSASYALGKSKNEVRQQINSIVDELHLNESFKIDA